MREVESMDDEHYSSNEKKNQQQYPLDLMDKLWDEYYDTRDGKVPQDPKAIAQQQERLTVRTDDYRSLLVKIDKLTLELSDAHTQIDQRDNMIWGLRSKLEEERKKAQWTRSDKIKKVMERNEL